jgi:hypothetical protein
VDIIGTEQSGITNSFARSPMGRTIPDLTEYVLAAGGRLWPGTHSGAERLGDGLRLGLQAPACIILEGRLLLANWLASSFAAAATPLLYVIRRSQMYRNKAVHLRRGYLVSSGGVYLTVPDSQAPDAILTSTGRSPARHFTFINETPTKPPP